MTETGCCIKQAAGVEIWVEMKVRKKVRADYVVLSTCYDESETEFAAQPEVEVEDSVAVCLDLSPVRCVEQRTVGSFVRVSERFI